MEGLEISEILLSDLPIGNKTFRIDSEFFKKEYLDLFEIINSHNLDKLSDVSSWITQGSNPVFSEEGIHCLTGRNINKGRVNYSNSDYVSDNEYNSLKRFQIKKGDTLVTLKGKGSIGKIGYVTEETKSIFSRDVGVIRPSKINSAYVNAYILSEYGGKIIERGETGGTGQSTLTVSYLKDMDIPRFNIENEIGNLIIKSESILKKSKSLYHQAEQLLLKEIGLEDFKPSEEGINIKSFQDSFISSGRLDAEYYQPKYEETIEKVKKKPYDLLKNIVSIKKSVEVGSSNYGESNIPFLRVADFSKQGITESQRFLSESYVEKNKALVESLKPKKGTILFSKDGSVGTAYHLRKDFEGITSGAILHLNLKINKNIVPEYLTLVLNSEIVQMQAERDAGGSIILHWRTDEIKNVVVPIINYEIQTQIASLVEESFSLKSKSEKLLSLAKEAVEMAIEQSEEKALSFIEQETNLLAV